MSKFGLLVYFVPIAVAPAPGVFFFNPPLLLLQPILVRLRRCRRRLPCPLQVESRLFPPPHPHLCPLLPLRRLTQVQNRSRRNILCDRILPSPNVGTETNWSV